jgi:GT2 family glycosyltransferase
MVGEDYFFCNEARRLGFETHVLPQARTTHTGSYDYVLNMPAIASLGAA